MQTIIGQKVSQSTGMVSTRDPKDALAVTVREHLWCLSQPRVQAFAFLLGVCVVDVVARLQWCTSSVCCRQVQLHLHHLVKSIPNHWAQICLYFVQTTPRVCSTQTKTKKHVAASRRSMLEHPHHQKPSAVVCCGMLRPWHSRASTDRLHNQAEIWRALSTTDGGDCNTGPEDSMSPTP